MSAREQYQRQVGARLRAVRLRQHRSLHEVADASHGHFKLSTIGSYERGERAITVPRLRELAELYHVSVDELLPPSGGRRSSAPARRIDLTAMPPPAPEPAAGPIDADLLDAYTAAVGALRRTRAPVRNLRSSDLRLLADLSSFRTR
jgi:transcriptional regulator with XRE-family HTH domain